MKESPLLFRPPLVKAILAGQKTQTRRLVKPQPVNDKSLQDSWIWHGGKALEQMGYGADYVHTRMEAMKTAMLKVCPYGQLGDRLWIRESWRAARGWDSTKPREIHSGSPIVFPADGNALNQDGWEADEPREYGKLRPSIFMPRWASRISLETTAVRVERLNDISEKDSISEGVERDSDGWIDYQMPSTQCCQSPKDSFRTLWESLNGSGTWDENPWVYVLDFKRIEV